MENKDFVLRLYAHVWGDHVTLAPPLIEPAAVRDRRGSPPAFPTKRGI